MYLQYIEFFSAIVSLCTLWLGIKQRIASWPISIAITLINLTIYHQGALYDKWLSGAISIAFSMYGWYQWLYGGPKHTILKKITTIAFDQLLAIIALSIAGVSLLSQILIYIHSDLPYGGALCTFLTILGLWMTAHKKLEAYMVWALLNIVSIYIHYYKSYYWFSGKYFMYLIGSIYGYMEWRAIYLSYSQEKS